MKAEWKNKTSTHSSHCGVDANCIKEYNKGSCSFRNHRCCILFIISSTCRPSCLNLNVSSRCRRIKLVFIVSELSWVELNWWMCHMSHSINDSLAIIIGLRRNISNCWSLLFNVQPSLPFFVQHILNNLTPPPPLFTFTFLKLIN